MVTYKVLLTSVLTASSLGLSTLSLADGNSTDGTQAVSNSSQNNNSGIYLGGQAGYTNSNLAADSAQPLDDQDPLAKQVTISNKKGKIGGRVYVGYKFNPYIAMEAGYSYLNKIKGSATANDGAANVKGSISTTVSTQAFDLAAKGILPLGVISDSLSNANLFVKAGVADIIYSEKDTGTLTITVPGIPPMVFDNSGKQTTTKIVPEFGGGAGYTFDNGLGLDVTYMRLQGRGEQGSDKFVPSNNTVMGGISYLFAV